MRRRALVALLMGLSVLLALAATLMVFAQDRIFDADDFAATLGSTLRDPAVNDYLADEVSRALIDQVPNLAISGPLLTDVTGSVLESEAAIGIVELSTREAHERLFADGTNTLTLELGDLVDPVREGLQAVSPDLAASIPDDVESLTIGSGASDLTANTVRFAERIRLLTLVLVGLAALSMIALVMVEVSLFRGLARLGLVLGSVGLLLIVTVNAGAAILASYGRGTLEQNALDSAWHGVLGDLVTWGWVLLVVGALIASVGWAVANAGNVNRSARELIDRIVVEPATRRANAIRDAAMLATGVWALTSPQSLLGVLVQVAGFALVVYVVARLIDRLGLAERLSRAGEQASAADGSLPLRSVGTRFGVTTFFLVGLGVGAVALLGNNDGASAIANPNACNGHVELCDRRLDEVTMAAAHNSMSSTATGFYLPNHLTSMGAMLDQGVRGFMIDTVYGQAADDGSVRTSLGLADVVSLDEAARQAAEAIQESQTGDLEPKQVYLCHGFCEIGALDAVTELRAMREWLDEHPREVVVIVVQDATEPDDTAQVFRDAGYDDIVLTQRLGDPLPTLGEMIESGRRVFIMVEESGDGVDWLHPAFEFSQETPFSFSSADEFSCEPNRGAADSPLFVVNHFITLAKPSNKTINDFDPLLDRAEQCQAERSLQPNLLAVDFVGEGDVMAVVDTLNGVD